MLRALLNSRRGGLSTDPRRAAETVVRPRAMGASDAGLRERHGLWEGARDDFSIRGQDAFHEVQGCGVSEALSLPVEPSLTALGLSRGVSSGIGVLFGLVPCWPAAPLDPILTLGHE